MSFNKEDSDDVDLELELDGGKGLATLKMSGPAGVWYGIGFNASEMKDAPWAVIVDGTGKVSERKLADQSGGTELPASVTVVSNTVTAGRRSVVLTRPLAGKTPQHLSFPANPATAPSE